MRRVIHALAFLAALLATAGGLPARAQAERPLLVEGTTTIYQRVLTRPGATRHPAPSAPAADGYPAFQPLYVFERRDDWLRVGPSTARTASDWVETAKTVAWKQNIVASFTNAAGRQRQLLFGSEERLRWLMEHEDLFEMQKEFLRQADANTLLPASGVVSMEPSEYVDITEELYLMPILDFRQELHPLNYEPTLLMQVASVPQEAQNLPAAPSAVASSQEDDFDAGVIFVLDTTQSMDRYIARTRSALARIINDIRGTDIGERVSFGVVGFRDNEQAVPGLAYRTKVLAPLARRDDPTPVLTVLDEAVRDIAQVSSPGFNEDSIAGVEDAIDLTDWDQVNVPDGGDPFDGRYIILVTDAGPKGPSDANARSAIGPAEIQADAEDRGIVVLTLHLKTPAGGEANHLYAESQYRQLSRFGDSGFYYDIPGGSEEAFEATVTTLVTALTDHVRVARGEATQLDDGEADQALIDLGLAMRLKYLGQRQGTRAPEVIEGWLSSRAVENPLALAIAPRLLVTKNEMATMAKLLEDLLIAAEAAQGGSTPSAFFDQIQGILSSVATDFNLLINPEADSLGAGLEFLDRLPYKSQLLSLDRSTWESSAMVRRPIIDGLRQKLAQYRKWLLDGSVWTSLYEGSDDGEHVFAMPFDVLP